MPIFLLRQLFLLKLALFFLLRSALLAVLAVISVQTTAIEGARRDVGQGSGAFLGGGHGYQRA